MSEPKRKKLNQVTGYIIGDSVTINKPESKRHGMYGKILHESKDGWVVDLGPYGRPTYPEEELTLYNGEI